MTKNQAKQMVYRYNGQSGSDEIEVDLDGEIQIPLDGQLITRNGKKWKVVTSITETTGPTTIPVVRIYLTD